MDEALLLNSLLVVWGAITLVFGALLMWKYLVGMREENFVMSDVLRSLIGVATARARRADQCKAESVVGWFVGSVLAVSENSSAECPRLVR